MSNSSASGEFTGAHLRASFLDALQVGRVLETIVKNYKKSSEFKGINTLADANAFTSKLEVFAEAAKEAKQ